MTWQSRIKGPTRVPVALLLVDVINHFEFPDGDLLLSQSLGIAANIAKLKAHARRVGVPVIYVNDNYGDWRSERSALLSYCLRPEAKGLKFVTQLKPTEEDYFVLKPMHSAFYQTPLDTLLRYLGARTLILAGLTTDSCIGSTASDANMREMDLIVPSDCCAARTRDEHRNALHQMKRMLHARTGRSAQLRFDALLRPTG